MRQLHPHDGPTHDATRHRPMNASCDRWAAVACAPAPRLPISPVGLPVSTTKGMPLRDDRPAGTLAP